MANPYKFFGVLLDSGNPFDEQMIAHAREILFDTAAVMRQQGRPVMRQTLAIELGIEINRMTRLIKALKFTNLFLDL